MNITLIGTPEDVVLELVRRVAAKKKNLVYVKAHLRTRPTRPNKKRNK